MILWNVHFSVENHFASSQGVRRGAHPYNLISLSRRKNQLVNCWKPAETVVWLKSSELTKCTEVLFLYSGNNRSEGVTCNIGMQLQETSLDDRMDRNLQPTVMGCIDAPLL